MWKRLKEKRVQQQQQRKQHQENDRKNSLLENCHQEFAFCMQNKFWLLDTLGTLVSSEYAIENCLKYLRRS